MYDKIFIFYSWIVKNCLRGIKIFREGEKLFYYFIRSVVNVF